MKGLRCLVIVVLCFVWTGCGAAVLVGTGAAAGVVGYKYYEGALIVTFKAPFRDTWDATLTALKGMNGVKIEKADHDITTGKIWAKFSDGKPVEVSLRYLSAKKTEARIRVGALGERDASEIVKDRIKEALFGK